MIRPVQADDLPFLEEMLYEAAAAYNPEVQAMGKEALLGLAVPLYLADWGREGDAGLVAVTETGQRLGAAWYRYPIEEARGLGFVASDIPELAIGLVPDARGRGLGTDLLTALLALARERGVHAMSLNVSGANTPARRLYEHHGFRDTGLPPQNPADIIMQVSL
jgi:ribosomal protein S18 acetylase RimI-like enzyme